MPINTEIEDNKTKFNINNKNILLHSSITFPFYLDLGGGGVICNFGFGLREKIRIFGMGGVICNSGFGLREKIWKFGFLGWGG